MLGGHKTWIRTLDFPNARLEWQSLHRRGWKTSLEGAQTDSLQNCNFFNSTPHHEGELGNGGIVNSFFDLGTRWRWVVSFTLRPLYRQRKRPWYPLDKKFNEDILEKLRIANINKIITKLWKEMARRFGKNAWKQSAETSLSTWTEGQKMLRDVRQKDGSNSTEL
jgi:hypothetical protein